VMIVRKRGTDPSFSHYENRNTVSDGPFFVGRLFMKLKTRFPKARRYEHKFIGPSVNLTNNRMGFGSIDGLRQRINDFPQNHLREDEPPANRLSPSQRTRMQRVFFLVRARKKPLSTNVMVSSAYRRDNDHAGQPRQTANPDRGAVPAVHRQVWLAAKPPPRRWSLSQWEFPM